MLRERWTSSPFSWVSTASARTSGGRRLSWGRCARRRCVAGSPIEALQHTNRPDSIGTFASYGCIRMLNDDIADLFERVTVGAEVVVTR